VTQDQSEDEEQSTGSAAVSRLQTAPA
jgi:hypothetical protein